MAEPSVPKDPLTLALRAWEDIAPFLDDPDQPEWSPSVYEIPLVVDFLSQVKPTTPKEEATLARLWKEVREAGRRWGFEIPEHPE